MRFGWCVHLTLVTVVVRTGIIAGLLNTVSSFFLLQALTASTAIASIAISGSTFHSFFGLTPLISSPSVSLKDAVVEAASKSVV